MRRTANYIESEARALASLLTYTEWNTSESNRSGGREVVEALKRLGTDAVPALADMLANPKRGRTGRMVAAWLLGRVDNGDATSALERATRDTDGEVAAAARAALKPEAAIAAA